MSEQFRPEIHRKQELECSNLATKTPFFYSVTMHFWKLSPYVSSREIVWHICHPCVCGNHMHMWEWRGAHPFANNRGCPCRTTLFLKPFLFLKTSFPSLCLSAIWRLCHSTLPNWHTWGSRGVFWFVWTRVDPTTYQKNYYLFVNACVISLHLVLCW